MWIIVYGIAAVWLTLGSASGQQTPPAPAPSSTASAGQTGKGLSPPPSQDAQAPATPPAPADDKAKSKKQKDFYTGPTTIITLEPTPMLDEEGKQRLDPDGKPMFNPAIKQMRDKKGHPVFDDQGKPVFQTKKDLGYDEKGSKIPVIKEKEPKVISVSIERGTLTLDGLTGKAGLNYEIKDFKYIYLYAPWVGLTVVSADPFPGAIEEKKAFDDKTLTVTAGEHTYQLYSEKRLLGKKPESAYVLVDREFSLPVKFPVMGYGPIRKPPYAWPGSRENVAGKSAVIPPPLPASLKPTLALPPCPTGMMRPTTTQPGKPAAACVAIKTASR